MIWRNPLGQAALALAYCFAVTAAAESVEQSLHDYQTVVKPAGPGRQVFGGPQRINPFLSYTNLGTDYGFIGQDSIMSWEPGVICIQAGSNQFGGVWHSLARRAVDPDEMDFNAFYPAFIRPQPKVTGLQLRVIGHGTLGVEIRTKEQRVIWERRWTVPQGDYQRFHGTLADLPKGKYLNWVAEADSDFCVDGVRLEIAMPELPAATEALLRSYAKLASCYSSHTGWMRDRAHLEDGAFDNVPATGMFSLATAAASRLGLVAPEFASATLHRIWAQSLPLEKQGVMPHFLRLQDGYYQIHPDTEYSTVDTALHYLSLLLAAQMLGEAPLVQTMLEHHRKNSFAELRDAQGRVRHGFTDQGKILENVWEDWGGESALVLIWQELAAPGKFPPIMKKDGIIFRGCGFIPEIQSLFFPDFSQDKPDALTGQNWQKIRREHFQQQRAYFDSLGPENRLLGLSAGENANGQGYLVSGINLEKQEIIHPHYLFMAWESAPDAQWLPQALQQLKTRRYYAPLGLAENIDLGSGHALPMIGALNAAFETLALYHWHQSTTKAPDAIYQASQLPALRQAMRIFYP